MRYHDNSERLLHLKKWVRYWDPRAKTVAGLLFIVGLVGLQTPSLLLGIFLFLLIVSRGMGVRLRYIATRLALLAPLLGLMALPLLFGGGVPPSQDRVDFAALLVLKALNSMMVVILMVTTQSLQEYLDGLAHLRIPPLLITVLFLAFRYAFLFIEELKAIQRALKARLFRPGADKAALAAYGELTGGMLIRAVDRSEQVYRAMAARGFSGQIPVAAPPNMTSKDICKALAAILLMGILLIVERGYLI